MIRVLLISAFVLGVIIVAVVILWFFRQKVYEIFGLDDGYTQRRQQAEEEARRQSAAERGQSGSAPARNAGRGSDGPMIVVAADDANRGELMSYSSLASACNKWAEANIVGRGAAAVVYKGQIQRFGSIAVKRFNTDHAAGMAWNFDRELEALSQCRHPHVLEILGRADRGPEQLIVMPLMEGGPLTTAMRSMRWAPRAVCFGQVVRAVSFLHGKKMVHRDIKSSNILLDRNLRHARLADFGLAKDQVKGSRTHGTTGIIVGSPGYMAPELMMRPANEKTDSFALGLVMLELLTGLAAWDENREAMALNDCRSNNSNIGGKKTLRRTKKILGEGQLRKTFPWQIKRRVLVLDHLRPLSRPLSRTTPSPSLRRRPSPTPMLGPLSENVRTVPSLKVSTAMNVRNITVEKLKRDSQRNRLPS